MRITGVVRPRENSSFDILEIGIEFPPALIPRLIAEAEQSPVVQAQLADPETDLLTGIPFGEIPDPDYGFLKDLIQIRPELLGDAVSFRYQDLDSLETEETRMTAVRAVHILRELRRTGESPTLKGMIKAGIPLLLKLVEIDEEGVTGAAYTELAMARSSMSQEEVDLIFDRPFYFAVVSPDGSLLFSGIVQTISDDV